MKKQVAFFGAGASYGARNNPSPPLGQDLHTWVVKYFERKYDELDVWTKEPWLESFRDEVIHDLNNSISFETLANKLWCEKKISHLEKLNFFLAASMTPPFNLDDPHEEPRVDDSFFEKSDVYDEWLRKNVKKIDKLKDFTFITLNYDCLLERAICRTFFTGNSEEKQCLCTHVHYPYINGPTNGPEVLKLHGSINWVGDPLGTQGSEEEPLSISIDEDGLCEYKKIEMVRSCLDNAENSSLQDTVELVIATYAPGKPPQANPIIFQYILDRAMKRVLEAQKIKIIGVHIPCNEQDDSSLWELFQALQGKNVDFINPNEAENKQATDIFGFHSIKMSFKEYVDSIT